MPHQRPHESSTHRSSRRGQKTVTKQPDPQEQVKDKQTSVTMSYNERCLKDLLVHPRRHLKKKKKKIR